MLVLNIVLVVALGLMIVALLAMKWRMDKIEEKYDYLFEMFEKQARIDDILIREAEKVHYIIEEKWSTRFIK